MGRRMPAPAEREPRSLVELLHRRAAAQPHDTAYIVLADRGGEEATITFAELQRRAHALARRIAEAAPAGERALLLFPSGIEFIVALFGCFCAGVIAVPMMLPRRHGGRDASASIVADCTPRLILSTRRLIAGERGDLAARFAGAGLAWLASDDADGADDETATRLADPSREDVALLQYTSGSTSAPKGVVVTHGNLLANLAMIRAAFGTTPRSTLVSWLPQYHDMGLVIHVLHAIYLGSRLVLISPVAFLQRPLNWLRAISNYRAEFSGAPNFAYELCANRYRAEQLSGLDLSCWRIAVNGAEPVRAGTIRCFTEAYAPHGFAAAAVYPAYGMAEATVLITAGGRGDGAAMRTLSREGLQQHRAVPPENAEDAQIAVGCGRAAIGERIAIADPDSLRRLGPDEVGEVWAAGDNVASGYWSGREASAAAFGATLAGEGEPCWLRTGDLGFIDAAGELFITGRIKDVIIIRGVNHYPQDIEHTVETAHPGLAQHGAAAFATSDAAGAERLVIVQEVARAHRRAAAPDELTRLIRAAVVADHDIAPYAIALIRPGTLPKTTSGKIQRSLTRQLWLEGRLDVL